MPEVALADALKERKQISMTVAGRRTGKQITIPVWFVSERNAISRLPVYGLNTQVVQEPPEEPRNHDPRGKRKAPRESTLAEKPRQCPRRCQTIPREVHARGDRSWYTGLDVAFRMQLFVCERWPFTVNRPT
jgi:hypothetical protein